MIVLTRFAKFGLSDIEPMSLDDFGEWLSAADDVAEAINEAKARGGDE